MAKKVKSYKELTELLEEVLQELEGGELSVEESMKKYEEALRARLENANVIYESGDYLERVATVTENMKGNDYDKDEDDF